MKMRDQYRIAFIAGKLGDVDGVSLEVDKWIKVLQELGHEIFVIGGEFPNPVENVAEENHFLVPEIGFGTQTQKEIGDLAFPYITSNRLSAPMDEQTQHQLMSRIWKEGVDVANKLQSFFFERNIDVMVGENTNAMPMSILAGVAIYTIATERNMACLFHHHDFWWERSRFYNNHIAELLNKVMPPNAPGIDHAVISSYAEHVLFTFKRITATIVPNCEDFSNPPLKDEYNSDLRQSFGIKDDELFVLQPTRIVPRKKIEDSIRFLSAFVQRFPKYQGKVRFIISLYAGDEGEGYLPQVESLAKSHGIRMEVMAGRVEAVRGTDAQGRKIYTNRDVLVNADFATYLPVWEGFGNALLEAWAARLLTVVSTYLVYKTDIRTIGPRGVEIVDRYDESGNLIIPDQALEDLERILCNPELKKTIVDHNCKVAEKAFSLEALKNILDDIFTDYGDEIRASRRRMKRAGHIFSV
ncbi:glycosyltransferase family 4 protein [Candidatus Haliotispira prima]|uniref:Glycosyltransferase family 4 protein n=1 Tax=Candidatus Haliotispira prima TaxID=3034016 RepID=A0ABY8MFH6_9SPIO|nr:glycosyltransferase family 4 protein [Candidatus Haliotispira prima]